MERVCRTVRTKTYRKIYESPPTKMVWSCWKNAKPKNVKTNCNSYNERNRERRRPRKIWRDKVEENLNTTGMKDRQAMARHRREC